MYKTTKEVLQAMMKKGYRYYEEEENNVITLIEKAIEWAGPLEEKEGYHIEEHPNSKSADVFIIKEGQVLDYLFTVRKRVQR